MTSLALAPWDFLPPFRVPRPSLPLRRVGTDSRFVPSCLSPSTNRRASGFPLRSFTRSMSCGARNCLTRARAFLLACLLSCLLGCLRQAGLPLALQQTRPVRFDLHDKIEAQTHRRPRRCAYGARAHRAQRSPPPLRALAASNPSRLTSHSHFGTRRSFCLNSFF